MSTFQRHADELVDLLTRAAAILDDQGHLHAPQGLGKLSGRFILKHAVADFDRRVKAAKKAREALDQAPIGTPGDAHRPLSLVLNEYRGLDAFSPIEQARIKSSIKEYGGDGFREISAVLRGGHSEFEPEPDELPAINDHIANLDKALGASRLESDVEVWRGTAGEKIFGARSRWPKDLKGFTWRDNSYVSTSSSRETSEAYIDGGVLMRLLVPKGAPAIQMSDEQFESELMLGRGFTFRVVKDHGTVNGVTDKVTHYGNGSLARKKRKVRLLDVEVIPASESLD